MADCSYGEDYSDDVRHLYAQRPNRAVVPSEHHVVMAGILIERLFPPLTPHDALRILIALNLLNATVKHEFGQRLVTYTYIKGMASCLFLRLVEHPLPAVSVYYSKVERVAYFRALGVQISFHYIPLYCRLRELLDEVRLEEQQWEGMELQTIADELFCTFCTSVDTWQWEEPEEELVRRKMLDFSRPTLERIHHGREMDEGEVKRWHKTPKPPNWRQMRQMRRTPFWEDKEQSLAAALGFCIWREDLMLLWRRKDKKLIPVIRYDGHNYDSLIHYLCGHDRNVYRRPEKTLEVGTLYHLSPQKRIEAVSVSRYVLNMTQNCYLRRGPYYLNLCLTYGIVRYLAVLHPKLKFVCTLDYNHLPEPRRYYMLPDLHAMPLDALERRLKVWVVVDTGRLLEHFTVQMLPQVLIDDYMQAEDYYQEFEITENDEGLKGIFAYRRFQLLPNVYRRIELHNYHAHILGDNDHWAVYGLNEECFKSGFIYERIWYDSHRRSIMGRVGNTNEVIYELYVYHK